MSMTVRRLAQGSTLSPGPTPFKCVQLYGSDALVFVSNAAELDRRLTL